MGYWAECVQDIDRSIEAGYPIAKQSKLQSRRKVCDQHLSNCVKSDSIESIVEKKPTIIDCDTEVNPLTVAEQCVSIGSIVWQEEAVAVQLSESRASTHCAFCIQPLPINPFPCRKCSFYRYCDSNCAQSDWTSGHRIDCCRSNWLRSIGFAQFNCIRLAIRLCLWSWPDRSTLLTKLCLKADPPTSATNDAFEVLSQTIPDISIGNWREIQRHLQTCFDIVQQYSQSICERLASTVTLSVGGLLQQIAVIRKIEQLPLADGVFLNWAFAMANGKTTKEGNCQTQKFVGRSITIFCTINIESGQALTAKPKTASNVLYEAHDGDTDQTTRVIQEIKKDIKNGQLALYSPQSNFRTAEHLLLKCHTRLMSVMLPDDIRMIDLTLNLAICYVGLRIMDRAVNHLLRAHEAMQRSIEPNPRPELDNLALWCKSVSVTFALYEWTRKSDQKKVLVNVDQWIDAIANHVNHIKRLNRLLGISNQESGILNQCQSIAQSNVNRCKNNWTHISNKKSKLNKKSKTVTNLNEKQTHTKKRCSEQKAPVSKFHRKWNIEDEDTFGAKTLCLRLITNFFCFLFSKEKKNNF